jgi:hypothetical protein
MVEHELPFGSSTAERLMAIAHDRRLTNPAHGQHLPPHWRTLYELARLSDKVFAARIADGTIYADMERGVVESLVTITSKGSRVLPICQSLRATADDKWPGQGGELESARARD